MGAEMQLRVQRGFKAGTMLSSINVPPELRRRVRCGMDWLDAFGGAADGLGYVPTTTVMLTGGPGTGKSTLMRQLASSFRSSPNVLSFYNTGEESLYQARMACERLELSNDFMVGEETHLPKLLEKLDQIRDEPKNRGKQFVFLQDSLQCLDDGKYRDGGTTGQTPVRCAEMLVDWSQRNFAVTWFVGQATKGGDFAGSNKILHAVDAHVRLFFDKKPKSDTFGMHLAECPKNRWGISQRLERVRLGQHGLENVYCAELDDAAE